LKWGDIQARIKGNLTAMIWNDKKDVHILMNMRRPPPECNFCDEHRKVQRPVINEDYKWVVGCVNK
jgi:hypothetical protein